MRRWWSAAFVLFLLAGMAHGQEELVSKITLLGNVRVEEGVIRGVIKTRVARPLSIDQVREDLRAIFNLGYFTDVQVDLRTTPQGKEVIFVVVERPSIKEVNITGHEKVKLDDIKEKVTLPTRSILNLEKVKENAEQIRKLYFSKGYYGVKVDSKIDYLETNEAVVTFQITEGSKGRIQTIRFKGNEKIKTSDLKKVMQTREWGILSFLTGSGVLDEDVLKNDVQILTAYCIDQGYLDVVISEPNIDLTNPARIRIEIGVSEGPQYRFGDIDFKGDVLTTKEDLFKTVTIKRGAVYSNLAIRQNIGILTEHFANAGYAYAEVLPESSVERDTLRVHVTFNIARKKQVVFEKIQVSGNTKTRDKVVRRELRVAEGELYNLTALNTSRARLRRLGFFKEVEFSTSRGTTDDQINLDVKVEETPTGALSFGLGYSSQYKAMVMGSLSDRNLFGLGYLASLRATIGGEATDFRASFTDPYFLGYPYAVGFDAYHERVDYFDTYSYKVTGGDIRAGKELSDLWRIDGMYKLETIDVFDVTPFAAQDIKDMIGRTTTSALSAILTFDNRDQYFAPTRGGRSRFFLEGAGGILGGNNDFIRSYLDASWYFPLPLKLVLNLRGKIGILEPYGDMDSPINERYYVGGIATVRGYEYGRAGPIDPVTDDPIGADKMVVFNSELIFPLAPELGLKGAVFFDAGKGFDKFSDFNPIRTAVGAGIRWFSPFGPLQIFVGFPLNPEPGEKSYVMDFSVGTVY